MDKDIFTNKEPNLFANNPVSEDNFFEQPEEMFLNNHVSEPTRRLNDYDFNILKEDAYKGVADERFKLEYKISKAEDELKNLEAQIQSAKEIRDFELVETLSNRKRVLQEDLAGLLEIYNDTSLSAKITGGLTSILPQKVKENFSGVKKTMDFFAEIVVSKLPKKFTTVLEIKKSLSKLENISKNVDELMTLQTPYGEAGDKYEQLSKYIIKANNIQAQISKSLKG